MPARGLRKVGSVHIGTLFQLFLSHLFVGLCVVVIGLEIGPIIVLPGAILGVVLTLNLSSSLHLLEVVLDRLAKTLPVETPAARWRWPLTPLFSHLHTLEQSAATLLPEQRAAEYRDQLSQQVNKTAAQEERNRLARDLHDSIKQQIFSVVVSAAAVKARWERDPAGARRIVDEIERTALEAQVEMQALLQELRPVALENVGLIESLRMQCQALGYRTGAEVTAELSELPAEDLLPPGAQEIIFRVVQEGFANIARHARASHIWLSLQQQQHALLVEIGDDGQGFALEEKPQGFGGMGLANIRERVRLLGGMTSIWSRINAGTTLHLYLPLVRETEITHEPVEDEEALVVVKKAQRSLNVGIKAIEFAIALALLYTPVSISFVLLGGGLIVALCSWLWSQRYRVQVAISLGRGSTLHSALLARSYGLLAGIVLIVFVWSGYFSYPIFVSDVYLWLAIGDIGICSVLLLIIVTNYFYAQERYYRQLSAVALRLKTRQELRYVVIDFLACALVTILTIIFAHVHGYFDLHQLDTNGWMIDTGLLCLLFWFLSILVRCFQIARWRWFVTGKAV